MRRCPACLAENDDDSDFCDQCSAALKETPAPGDGCCPECGGQVAEEADGAGACRDCGARLVEAEAPSESPSEKLARLIKENLAAGLPLHAAVDAGCRSYFYKPDEESKAPSMGGVACPVCGESNPREAVQCGGCAILFESPSLPAQCPVCAEKCSGDTCPCGAVLALSKLAESADDSVAFVCPHCKSLFTKPLTECGDCGNSPLLPADRLKEYARSRRES